MSKDGTALPNYPKESAYRLYVEQQTPDEAIDRESFLAGWVAAQRTLQSEDAPTVEQIAAVINESVDDFKGNAGAQIVARALLQRFRFFQAERPNIGGKQYLAAFDKMRSWPEIAEDNTPSLCHAVLHDIFRVAGFEVDRDR